MSLYNNWLGMAYNKDGVSIPAFWDEYMPLEQGIYEKLISKKTKKISGTVSELAEKFKVKTEYICGFLDGINDATGNTVDMQEIEETTKINITIDYEKLYKKMVEYKAEHLYNLEQWDKVFDEETRKRFVSEQKKSGTYINENKIGSNDQCSCGSVKKYKKCCGA